MPLGGLLEFDVAGQDPDQVGLFACGIEGDRVSDHPRIAASSVKVGFAPHRTSALHGVDVPLAGWGGVIVPLDEVFLDQSPLLPVHIRRGLDLFAARLDRFESKGRSVNVGVLSQMRSQQGVHFGGNDAAFGLELSREGV